MGHNWTKTNAIFGGVGVFVAIGFGLATVWDELFPSTKMQAALESIKWKIGEGRLGKGPYAIIKLQLSNTGTTASTLSSINIKFALGKPTRRVEELDCYSSEVTWMGVPWEALLRGSGSIQAVSVRISPGEIMSEVVFFEPANVLSYQEREAGSEYNTFARIEFKSTDNNLSVKRIRSPLGWVAFTDDRIIDFIRVDDFNRRIDILT